MNDGWMNEWNERMYKMNEWLKWTNDLNERMKWTNKNIKHQMCWSSRVLSFQCKALRLLPSLGWLLWYTNTLEVG